MSKIDLNNVAGGFNLSKINLNFQKIETALNDGALWRDNPSGEPNQMVSNLDMNGNRLYNLPAPSSDNEPVRRIDLNGIKSVASYNKTVRVEDNELPSVGVVDQRKDKLLSFDGSGNPETVINKNSLELITTRSVLYFQTKSEALAANLPEGSVIEVVEDRTCYQVVSQALVVVGVYLRDTSIPFAPVSLITTTSKNIALTDAGFYLRFTGTGAKTCSFNVATGFTTGQEFHITNRSASGNITLAPAGVTLNAPKNGTLNLEPGDTVTVKFISGIVADVMGSTEVAP